MNNYMLKKSVLGFLVVVFSLFIWSVNTEQHWYLSPREANGIPTDQNFAIISSWNTPTNATENNFSVSATFADELYFAESNANKIGRLAPATNTITEWDIPTNGSGVADIVFDVSSGNVYFAESNANKIGRLSPMTGTFTEWPTDGTVKKMDVDPSGDVYYVNGRGTIIRMD